MSKAGGLAATIGLFMSIAAFVAVWSVLAIGMLGPADSPENRAAMLPWTGRLLRLLMVSSVLGVGAVPALMRGLRHRRRRAIAGLVAWLVWLALCVLMWTDTGIWG